MAKMARWLMGPGPLLTLVVLLGPLTLLRRSWRIVWSQPWSIPPLILLTTLLVVIAVLLTWPRESRDG